MIHTWDDRGVRSQVFTGVASGDIGRLSWLGRGVLSSVLLSRVSFVLVLALVTTDGGKAIIFGRGDRGTRDEFSVSVESGDGANGAGCGKDG